MIESEYKRLLAEGRMYFGKDGNAVPARIQYLKDIDGLAPWTWWPHEEVGHTDESKKEIQALFGKTDTFDTPKPERLVHRILTIATNPGDLVLDSFAGSGTTGAVAHKMGRRWIMVELGEHCHTHIIPRLKKVIDGQDPGGVTEAIGWKGGGGFRYFRLAPSLLEKDSFGNWIISKKYNAAMLAEALCKLEGFTYAPSETDYWQHGHSTESDFIYVTTQTLTREQLAKLSEEVGDKRSLLVMCSRVPRQEPWRVPEPDGQEDSQGGARPAASGARTTTAWRSRTCRLPPRHRETRSQNRRQPRPAQSPADADRSRHCSTPRRHE